MSAGAGSLLAQPPPASQWVRVSEDERAIQIETDKLEAVIPKRNPKHWMTGIEKGSFLDKTTGFQEVGDGLMVVDWLMEAGSDQDYGQQVIAPDGYGSAATPGMRARPTRSGELMRSWPMAAAIASAWWRVRSFATE